MDATTDFVNKLMANYQRTISDLMNQNIVLQTQLQVANERLAQHQQEALTQPTSKKKSQGRADNNDDESF